MDSWRIAIAAGVLIAGILLGQTLPRSEAVPLRRSFEEFPLELGRHHGTEAGLDSAIVNALGVTDFMMRRYAAPELLPVWLYVGYYASQRTGVIIHSPKQCLPGNGWSILRSESVEIEMPGAGAARVTVNRVLVGKGDDRQIVLYWYQARGRVVASEYWGKAFMMWDSIVRARTDGALVRLSAPVSRSEDEAYRQLVDFSRRIFPLLSEFLPA